MSHREQPGAAGVAHPSVPTEPAAAPRNGDHLAAVEWESLFPAFAARARWLRDHRLPLPGADRARVIFATVPQALPPFRPEAVEPIDRELDAAQLDAVARALHTPDLALIQGGPGSGKSRVIAEIIRQAVRRGERVLLTAPTPAALDIVLERMADDEAVIALRCPARDERPEDLPPAAAARTFAVLQQNLAADALARSRVNLQDAERRLESARADLLVLDRLAELTGRFADGKSRREAAAALAQHAEPGDDFARQLTVAQADHDARLQQLDEAGRDAAEEFGRAQKRIAELDAELTGHRQAESQRGWLARLLPFGAGRAAEPSPRRQSELHELRQVEARAKKRAEEAAVERQQLAAAWRQERQRRLDAESVRRRAEDEGKIALLDDELATLEPVVRSTAAELSTDCVLADPFDPTAVARAREGCSQSIEQIVADAAATRSRVKLLNDHGGELPKRLFQGINLVAIPLTALTTEAALAELVRGGPFDLLILDEAHRTTELEVYAAAKQASRWVLVGEPASEELDMPERRGRAPARSCPWPRLWRAAHAESWRVEAGRLCCRLRPLSPEQRRELEFERVADAPEIELRIWTPRGGEPVLAEVLFPSAMTIDQALTYLYRELNELPAAVAPASWLQRDGQLMYCLFNAPAARPVELVPGLSALMQEQGGAWRLAAVGFDAAAGWDRYAAEAWVSKSLRFVDTGRTALLTAQYRMRPAIAAFACALGLEGACPPARPEPPPAGPAVEFIPVPALANESQARRRGDVGYGGPQRRLPPSRGGAGLDVDLADARAREQLPPELHAVLPARGFVNLAEAEAIVRLLENLIDDLPADHLGSIAALPLNDAQATLVRQLVNQSPTLTSSPISISIATPTQFRQREADLVIVGLTRSHGHRAVSYGEQPDAVPLALTRARRRLILVGDPGTLARRAGWDGPLEQLDSDAARRERAWVSALVRLLQGHGPPVIQLREGMR